MLAEEGYSMSNFLSTYGKDLYNLTDHPAVDGANTLILAIKQNKAKVVESLLNIHN